MKRRVKAEKCSMCYERLDIGGESGVRKRLVRWALVDIDLDADPAPDNAVKTAVVPACHSYPERAYSGAPAC